MIRIAVRCFRAVLPSLGAAAAILAMSGVGVGCGDSGNSLGGSVEEIYELSFQTVRARHFDSEFSIEYTREDGQIPVRVIVERGAGSGLSEGEIDLGERGTIVGRVGPRRLPQFESGTLQLNSYEFSSGAPVEGSFRSTHRSEDASYTLRGKFSTTLEIVDGSIGYPYPDVGDASAGADGTGADAESVPDTTSPPADDAAQNETGGDP